jgi:hypothetical protein
VVEAGEKLTARAAAERELMRKYTLIPIAFLMPAAMSIPAAWEFVRGGNPDVAFCYIMCSFTSTVASVCGLICGMMFLHEANADA